MFRSLLGAEEFYHTAQLDGFFAWLKTKSFSKPFSVSIHLPLQKEIVDSNRKKPRAGARAGFVICTPHQLQGLGYAPEQWHCIWYAEEIEIWESRELHEELPLRWGLTLEEKEELLPFARGVMRSFFDKTEVFKPNWSGPRIGEKARVDVALWVDGELRGSIISPSLPLLEAIQYASRGVLRDVRMKPIEREELERARIEISFMSDLVLPLRGVDLSLPFIDARRGFFVSYAEKQGWYLPTVFNCVKLRSMADLKKSLVKDKAKITVNDSKVTLYAFLTEGWIEGAKQKILLLEGPVAYPTTIEDSFLERVRMHAEKAAHWLLTISDMHGALPLYVDPLSGRNGRMDWGRLAGASYALAAYGKASRKPRFVEQSKKISHYLERYSALVGEAALLYAGHAALERREVPPPLPTTLSTPSPILQTVHASLLIRSGEDHLTKGISQIEKLLAEFKKNKEGGSTQLALYPELLHALALLPSRTGDSQYELKAEELIEWFVTQQLPNGSFPIYKDSAFAYTRGTGKIFECLALYPACRKATERAFDWLTRMQYTEENLYFAAADRRARLIGGLRHDHGAAEVWIDSGSHFLLGCARILSHGDK
jgi:AMMECR1 domain-containing protein